MTGQQSTHAAKNTLMHTHKMLLECEENGVAACFLPHSGTKLHNFSLFEFAVYPKSLIKY